MSHHGNILIVDDTKDGRLLLKMMLEDDYEITEVDSGEGFEAGGNDYLIKPVDEDDLSEKVSACLKRQNEISQTQQQARDATNMAMEALTVNGELGQIINFVKKIQSIDTLEEVAQSVLDIAMQFGLNSSVMISIDEKLFVGCETGSLEANLLAQVANSEERIFSVGIRTVVKYDHIVLLIKDMPLDDENRYGRLKDHLAVLMDLADGHLVALEARAAVLKQRNAFLRKIISVAEEQILMTSETLSSHQLKSQKIMQGMLSDLEGMLFSLGLDDDQESQLIKLADKTSQELNEASNSSKDLTVELGVILEKLYEFVEQ